MSDTTSGAQLSGRMRLRAAVAAVAVVAVGAGAAIAALKLTSSGSSGGGTGAPLASVTSEDKAAAEQTSKGPGRSATRSETGVRPWRRCSR